MSTIVLRNCVILDGHSPELLDGADVLIEDNEIQEVSDRPLKSAIAQQIDLNGRFLMPGLIDAHFHAYAAHVNLASLDDWPMSLLGQHTRTLLENALQRGFTTVWDAAGADFGLAAAVEQGLIKGPRIFFSGRALSQTGGHGDTRPVKDFEPCACGFQGSLSQVADGVDTVRRAAQRGTSDQNHGDGWALLTSRSGVDAAVFGRGDPRGGRGSCFATHLCHSSRVDCGGHCPRSDAWGAIHRACQSD